MRILAIAGSLRESSVNRSVIEAAQLLAPAGVEIVVYTGLATLPHFNPELDAEGAVPPRAVAELRSEIGRARGLLISSPEYAHGVPGSLKNALDWLVSSTAFPGMPVALVNASLSSHHAHDALVEILTTMSAEVVAEASIRIPVTDRTMDAARIAADPVFGPKLKGAVAALVVRCRARDLST